MATDKFIGKHETTSLGTIIVVYRNGEPVGRIRQIGRTHPDCRLEWITWRGGKRTDHGIQFPFVYLRDISPEDVQRAGEKYLAKKKPARTKARKDK